MASAEVSRHIKRLTANFGDLDEDRSGSLR
jgi:hypothetical protein